MEVTKLLLLAGVIVSIIYYIVFKIRRRRLYKLAAQFKGPCALPLIGNVLQLSVPQNEIATKLANATSFYKSPCKLWFGPFLLIYVCDPENVKIVINNPASMSRTSFFNKNIESITGESLITLPADKWKPRRKLISPVFNKKYLEGFVSVFSENAGKMADDLRCMVDTGIFNVEEASINYSMNTIMEAIFGVEQIGNHGNYIKKWIATTLGVSILRVTKIWYFFDFVYFLSPIARQAEKQKKVFDTYMKSILRNWEENAEKKVRQSNDNGTDYKQAMFIKQLASATNGNSKLTLEELRKEIATLITAGLETTSTSLGYVLIMLGMHPHIQEKAYQEVVQCMGGRKQVTNDDLKHFAYLERVIKETLRLFPPAAILSRQATQEIQLENHTVPADTPIGIGIFTMHRDPSIWPNPSVFDPDRFLPEEESKRHVYSYLPFSGGPRNCVGLRFAWMSLKIVVATLLLNYRLTTDYTSVDDVQLTMMVIFRPVKGYNLGITARK